MVRIFMIISLFLALPASYADVLPDTVHVGETRYAVPELWLGLRMGPADATPPADLILLPESLCTSGAKLYLREEAQDAFVAMCRAARRDDVVFTINSAYRSIQTQRELILKRLKTGRTFEDITWSVAPPGYSEHMLGTTVDLNLGPKRGEGSAYAWLRRHAGEYGFVESYPYDPTQLFPYEPWHWRWRGRRPSPGPTGKADAHGP